ncbi:hypothetical protein Tco_0092584 [Tanacetum coccineum]
MSSITAQQTKLDLELIPKEKRLNIGKCNGRLNPRKIQREPTFQVVLDALALTPCYFAFLITANGQDFDALPTNEEIMSFLRDLGYSGKIHSLNDVVVDQMHQPWRTFAALINRSLYGKTIGLDKLRLSRAQILWEPIKKSKRVKRSAKKSIKAPAGGVVIRETPEMPLSKKKEKVDVARGKGIELLSEVALTEDAQYEEVRRKSLKDFQKTHPSGSGVLDVTEEESSESEVESWGNDEDDSNNEQDSSDEDNDQENDSDDDKTQSNDENESDSDHETDENESGLEFDQEENEEDIGDY